MIIALDRLVTLVVLGALVGMPIAIVTAALFGFDLKHAGIGVFVAPFLVVAAFALVLTVTRRDPPKIL